MDMSGDDVWKKKLTPEQSVVSDPKPQKKDAGPVSRKGYPLTTQALFIFVVVLFASGTVEFTQLLSALGTLGYVGAFLAGIFFVSSFTVGPAAVILFHLGSVGPLWSLSLIAGLGAAFGDVLIFRFLKDGVYKELAPRFSKLSESRLSRALQSPKWRWVLPILGGIIIASPFPDEIGIALMGFSSVRWWQFFPLAVVLNSIGIFFVLGVARSF